MPVPLGFWATAGAGGAGATYEQIATSILSVDTYSISFTSIPQTYKHLQLRWTCRSAIGTTPVDVKFVINGDTGANYNYHALVGYGSGVFSEGYSSSNLIARAGSQGQSAAGSTSVWGTGVMDLLDYSSTVKNKTVRALSGAMANAGEIALNSSLWRNTSAITSILVISDGGSGTAKMIAGTRFSLYGIKG